MAMVSAEQLVQDTREALKGLLDIGQEVRKANRDARDAWNRLHESANADFNPSVNVRLPQFTKSQLRFTSWVIMAAGAPAQQDEDLVDHSVPKSKKPFEVLLSPQRVAGNLVLPIVMCPEEETVLGFSVPIFVPGQSLAETKSQLPRFNVFQGKITS